MIDACVRKLEFNEEVMNTENMAAENYVKVEKDVKQELANEDFTIIVKSKKYITGYETKKDPGQMKRKAEENLDQVCWTW